MNIPKGLLVNLVVILLSGGVGSAGFFIGKASVDSSTPYHDGYERGKAVGTARTATAINDRYQPGEPEYERIFASGRRKGYRTGKNEGVGAGRREGFSVGQDSAFEGYAGGWEMGRFYIIRIGQGHDGARYSIPSRSIMDSGESYNICPDDADELCGGSL